MPAPAILKKLSRILNFPKPQPKHPGTYNPTVPEISPRPRSVPTPLNFPHEIQRIIDNHHKIETRLKSLNDHLSHLFHNGPLTPKDQCVIRHGVLNILADMDSTAEYREELRVMYERSVELLEEVDAFYEYLFGTLEEEEDGLRVKAETVWERAGFTVSIENAVEIFIWASRVSKP